MQVVKGLGMGRWKEVEARMHDEGFARQNGVYQSQYGLLKARAEAQGGAFPLSLVFLIPPSAPFRSSATCPLFTELTNTLQLCRTPQWSCRSHPLHL